MSGAVHVEVAIGDPDSCQVAPHSEQRPGTVTEVSKSPDPTDGGGVVEEFTMTVPAGAGTEREGCTDDGVEKLFGAGRRDVFRFTRSRSQSCVCEHIERHGCPVRDVTAVRGTLYVTFVAPDHDTLQAALADLTDEYDEMTVCRLLQSEGSSGSEQPVFVDIGALTERQQEVLSTAHEFGYFEHPRSTNAAEVAGELGIAKSTFSEHLAAAQQNLLDELLEE